MQKNHWTKFSSILIKSLSKLGIEWYVLNLLKGIHKKTLQLISHLIVEAEFFFPKIRLGRPLSPLLFNTVLEVLASINRQVKEMKVIHIGKKKYKSFYSQMT